MSFYGKGLHHCASRYNWTIWPFICDAIICLFKYHFPKQLKSYQQRTQGTEIKWHYSWKVLICHYSTDYSKSDVLMKRLP